MLYQSWAQDHNNIIILSEVINDKGFYFMRSIPCVLFHAIIDFYYVLI